ncbi:ribokinase-like isoform X2 [Vespa velutina]|nr:ribokinase-like isoform X2 [Vespa velutina]XP_047357046.1 ribokinase-like isoform X2 [Vespa velutina]
MSTNIVVLGSCMIDFTCYASRLPKPGETIFGSEFKIKYGGKGANQCVSAAKLGATTTLIGSLGNDNYAKTYLDILKKENVDTAYIQIQKDKQSGIAHITVASNGENSIVVVPGANDLLSVDQVIYSADLIKNATVLLCQFESPLDATLQALRIHKGHGLSIVNGSPAVENIHPEIFELCDIFCINETEAELITGVQPLMLSNAQNAIDILFSKGCNMVILTLGSLGAVYASKENRKITQISTTKVDPIDTTGAGDAFLGSLSYFKAYHPHLSTKECISRACKIATETVLKIEPNRSKVRRAHRLVREAFSFSLIHSSLSLSLSFSLFLSLFSLPLSLSLSLSGPIGEGDLYVFRRLSIIGNL